MVGPFLAPGYALRCGVGALLPHLGATWAHVGAMLAHLAAMWAHFGAMWAHLGVGCASGFGVGGLGLVGRGLCWKVWSWWVGVGQCLFVPLGLELVGWGWSVAVGAGRHRMGGLG